MTAKNVAIILGVVFLAVGALGFIENPLVGESADAMFLTDQLHNIVHIVTGVLFLLVAFAAPGSITTFMVVFGLVYLALGVYGVATMGENDSTELLGFLVVNANDNYLHIGLGVVILLLGLATRRAAVTT